MTIFYLIHNLNNLIMSKEIKELQDIPRNNLKLFMLITDEMVYNRVNI